MKGEKAFTKEEIEEVYGGFFTDGRPRNIVVLSKEVTKEVGKTSGKPYTKVTWEIADAGTGETYKFGFDFNFTKAMLPFKEEMRYETSVYTVIPRQSGERNGQPVFDYDIQYVGEDGQFVDPTADKPAPTETSPF